MSENYAIEVKNLSKFYGTSRGIDSVNLTVNKGEIVGFVGQNGAGKSTTIKTLLNLIFPTSGTASVFNYDCVTESKLVKKITGYVPSEIIYAKKLKPSEIFENTCSFSEVELDKNRARELCEILQLTPSLNVGQLSMGNRKKVAIIQALIKKPQLLILDEPTNGLDPLIQEKLFEILEEERKKGLTIFLSSHNLAEVNRYCDRVIVIKDGKIIDEIIKGDTKNGYKVRLKEKDKDERVFDFDGTASELIAFLSKLEVEAIEISKVSIENEFLKYYQ